MRQKFAGCFSNHVNECCLTGSRELYQNAVGTSFVFWYKVLVCIKQELRLFGQTSFSTYHTRYQQTTVSSLYYHLAHELNAQVAPQFDNKRLHNTTLAF